MAYTHSGTFNHRPNRYDANKQPLQNRQKDDLVPCSDCAGQVLAVGSSVKNFSPGDRVCASFGDLVHGDITFELRNSSLGGLVDGVLTEVRVFKAFVSIR